MTPQTVIATLRMLKGESGRSAAPVGDQEAQPPAQAVPRPPFRLGPLVVIGGMAVAAALTIGLAQNDRSVKIDISLDKGFEIDIGKGDVRDLVSELRSLPFPDPRAVEIRRLRTASVGPWEYPKVVMSAQTVPGIGKGEAAVCRESEFLGEQIVLANRTNGLQAVKVAASLFPIGCTKGQSGNEIIFLGEQDMKNIVGQDGVRDTEVTATILAKELTRPLADVVLDAPPAAAS